MKIAKNITKEERQKKNKLSNLRIVKLKTDNTKALDAAKTQGNRNLT